MIIAKFGLAILVTAGPMAAQIWDNTGNDLLNGTYYFRQVIYVIGDGAGDLQDATAVYGTIAFDGTGGYSISASYLDYQSGSIAPLSVTGTYSISASGFGFLSNPVLSGQSVYGLVSKGIFIGSSTESGYNDLFIAAPVGSAQATEATLKGSYSIAYFNSPGTGAQGGVADAYDALLQLTANGAGSIGTVDVTAYIGSSGANATQQTESGVIYSASSGAEVVTFPSSSSDIVNGLEFLYISPDGSFVFGGSPQAFDMFVGVRTGTSGSNFGGFYYQVGLDEDESNLASGFGLLDTFYGSFSANNGNIVGHQRLLSPLENAGAFSVTYPATYPKGSNGTYTDSITSTQYVSGEGGAIVIGLGQGTHLGIRVAVQAPNFSSSGVYIYPNGVVNAASSAPFTAGVVPGELITIYGQDLAPGTEIASVPFPMTLNKVQVLINGAAVPVYAVSATQISAQVPFEITSPVAQIQVVNSGSLSNAVTEFVYQTLPGVFTEPPGGLGLGAVLHANFELVTEQNPAKVGETVLVYATGLGTVFPTVADGAAAPLSSLSRTSNVITAYIGGAKAGGAPAPSGANGPHAITAVTGRVKANVTFAGLAPGYAGLYQINVQIPSGLTNGDNALDIEGPDSSMTEAIIPISGGVPPTADPSMPLSVQGR